VVRFGDCEVNPTAKALEGFVVVSAHWLEPFVSEVCGCVVSRVIEVLLSVAGGIAAVDEGLADRTETLNRKLLRPQDVREFSE
jgi:hypothetical protein